MASIPIRNVYYLLSYAWDVLPESGTVDVGRLDYTELADLLAHVLSGGVEHVIRRGLERRFLDVDVEVMRLRGRVRLVESEARLMFQRGRALCSTEDLSTNSLANQIVRASLKHLAGVGDLDAALRRRLLNLYRALRDVDDIRLDASMFGRVHVHLNNRYYRFLLNVCELAHESCLVDESTGQTRFRDFLRDDRKMAVLFQKFVCNFCKTEGCGSEVGAESIAWRAFVSDDYSRRMLPQMKTDISMRLGETKLIIDTKYYSDALNSYFDTAKVRSEHLYQLLAYLSNTPAESFARLEGLLLYPAVGASLRLCFDDLQGFRVRVCTLDLSADWKAIRAELMDIVSDVVRPGAVGAGTLAA